MVEDESLLPQLRTLSEKACVAEGLELAWLELARQHGEFVLRVFIDRAGSESDPARAVGIAVDHRADDVF